MKFLRRHPLLTVFCTAAVLRLIFLLFFVSSPFRFFHTVPGLDMQTLLKFGEWGTPGNTFFLTLHRLQTFLFWKINNGIHPVMWHALFQGFLGACGAVMLAGITLKITGKKIFAAAAGVIWALNPVGLMYEFTTLQDSLVNFTIIAAFYAFLAARKHRFTPIHAMTAGAVTGICSTGRPVALGFAFVLIFWCAWYLRHRKLPVKRAAVFCSAILSVWIIFAGINLTFGNHFTCFFNPVSYAVSINTVPAENAKPQSAPERSVFRQMKDLSSTAGKMVCRIPKLLHVVEQPENLNIYYLRQKLPPLNLPFEFVMIFAAAGFCMIIISGKWKKKEGLILLPIISVAFFICIREPIGRYRLIMLPWFIMLGVWLVQYALQSRKRILLSLLLLFAAELIGAFSQRPLRASDLSAWGWALEGEAGGKITNASLEHFTAAWRGKPDTANAVNVITRAIRTNNRELAETTAFEWVKSSNSSSIACYYAAIAAMPVHKKMSIFLRSVRPEELPSLLRMRYYLMNGDVLRSSGNHAEAIKNYCAVLKMPECTPAIKRYVDQFVKK